MLSSSHTLLAAVRRFVVWREAVAVVAGVIKVALRINVMTATQKLGLKSVFTHGCKCSLPREKDFTLIEP